MEQLIKVGLEDISKCFDIDEDLYKKYYQEEILKDKNLVGVINARNNIGDWRSETPLGGPGTVLNGIILYCLIRHYKISCFLVFSLTIKSYYCQDDMFLCTVLFNILFSSSTIPLALSLER